MILEKNITVEEPTRVEFRHFPGLIGFLIKIFSASSCLFCLFYMTGIFTYTGFYIISMQYRSIFLAIVLTLTFLLIPAGAKAPKNKLPWYDLLFIIGGLAGTLYVAFNSLELLYFGKLTANLSEVILGSIMLIVLMEAVRRGFGWPMIIVVSFFILYAKFSYLIPGRWSSFYLSWPELITDIYISTQGIFGILIGIASTIILSFIIFGVFFIACGGGKFFIDLAFALTGSMKGGPANAAVLGSALFGTLSGSPTANVAVTGSITIPMMISVGFKPYFAAAISTIATTGGAIMPPVMGGVAFIMASMLGISYAEIARIAIFPAILYYISLYSQVYLQSCKLGISGLPREQLPLLGKTLKSGWVLFIPFLFLIVTLFIIRYPPEKAAVYSILPSLILGLFKKKDRIDLKKLIDILDKGLLLTIKLGNILALAGIILAMLTVTGLGPRITNMLIIIFGNNRALLLIAAGAACYILGMGISWIAAYILVSSIVVPVLVRLGMSEVVSSFFIMYFVLSGGFTPPYCTTAYVSGAIANANPFRVGFKSMQLGIVCFLVPFIIAYNPALLLFGDYKTISIAVLTSIVAVIALGIGFEGFLFFKMGWFQRTLFFMGAILLIVQYLISNFFGIGLITLAALWQWRLFSKSKDQSSKQMLETKNI